MPTERIFNGIDGSTGEYAFRASLPEVGQAVQSSQVDKCEIEDNKAWLTQLNSQDQRSLRDGDPRDLSASGWGVIFAEDDPQAPAIREALSDLLELRKDQVGKQRGHYYQEYLGARGYRRGDTKQKFLRRHAVGPGAADPDKMPYYLLLVGSPEQIPFTFQYLLDVEYAVGRLHFVTLGEYAAYAKSVCAAEEALRVRRRPRAVFFGVENPGDRLTPVIAKDLVEPLATDHARRPGWDVQLVLGEAAKRDRLARLLGGDETPDLLFTGSHGILFPSADPRHRPHQGALLCSDWPGVEAMREKKLKLTEDYFFSGEHVDSSSTHLQGLVSFHWACFSAGTPAEDDFTLGKRVAITPEAFVANLPQRLLGHPKGGALAVIGHVEKVWGCSILWPTSLPAENTFPWIQPFEDVFRRLAAGHPVGSALEVLGKRYAELSTELNEDLKGGIPDDELFPSWTACNDARNYVVLGDPAVRIVGVQP
jgi:hypothetical protein